MSIVQISEAQSSTEAVWGALQVEAVEYAGREQALSSLLFASIINQESFCRALASHLAGKLGTSEFSDLHLRKLFLDIYRSDDAIIKGAVADLVAVRERDPACLSYLQCFLYFKGFVALQTYRISHALWGQGRKLLAYHMQSRASELFAVDIHPAARFGYGIMLDHATGLVAGETSAVGDGCSILHGVTLGGTGKEHSDRHPKIGKNVLIGAGAKILGNITVGESARIASGSVVLKPVHAQCTVAGVPAKPVGGPCCENPAAEMNQILGEKD
ncbi:MAG: serine O-acetyltransferase [Robiginitomaculum sp.]